VQGEALEDLVYFVAASVDGQAGKVQLVVGDGGDGGPVVVIVIGFEKVLG
jgi:hypothetical protein